MSRLFPGIAALGLVLAVTPACAQRGSMKDISRADFIKQIDERFAKLDTDGNGTLSKAELTAQSGGQPAMRPDAADADKDGSVTKKEFETAALARFAQMDTNHDGTVTTAERAAMRGGMGRGGMGMGQRGEQ